MTFSDRVVEEVKKKKKVSPESCLEDENVHGMSQRLLKKEIVPSVIGIRIL